MQDLHLMTRDLGCASFHSLLRFAKSYRISPVFPWWCGSGYDTKYPAL